MTLRRNVATAPVAAPAFEAEDDLALQAQASQDAGIKQDAALKDAQALADAAPAAPAPAADPAPASESRALAAPRSTPLANAALSTANVLAGFKNALTVDYNTLLQIQATQGSFFNRETEEDLGKEIHIEMLSFQDSYVVSPNDDDADKDLVKYSVDGKVCKDGTPCTEHLKALQDMGYEKAKISNRVVLVAAVLACPAAPDLVGELVQFDMAPSSKKMFDRLMIKVSYHISKGILTPEAANLLKLTTAVVKGEDKKTYTLINFALNN